MQRFSPTTPLMFFVRKSTYKSGSGSSATYKQVESKLNDAGEKTGIYYAEWSAMGNIRRKYGEKILAAKSIGVNNIATVRMVYNPDVVAAMEKSQVVIVKNMDEEGVINGVPQKDNPNVYELFAGPEDDLQFMNFTVKRYEAK